MSNFPNTILKWESDIRPKGWRKSWRLPERNLHTFQNGDIIHLYPLPQDNEELKITVVVTRVELYMDFDPLNPNSTDGLADTQTVFVKPAPQVPK